MYSGTLPYCDYCGEATCTCGTTCSTWAFTDNRDDTGGVLSMSIGYSDQSPEPSVEREYPQHPSVRFDWPKLKLKIGSKLPTLRNKYREHFRNCVRGL